MRRTSDIAKPLRANHFSGRSQSRAPGTAAESGAREGSGKGGGRVVLLLFGLILAGIAAGVSLGNQPAVGELNLPWNTQPAPVSGPQPKDPQVLALLEQSREAMDLDSARGQKHALKLLDQALTLDPTNHRIRLERAVVLIGSALTLQRQAELLRVRQTATSTSSALVQSLMSRAKTMVISGKAILDAVASGPLPSEWSDPYQRAMASYYLATHRFKEFGQLINDWKPKPSMVPYRAYLRVLSIVTPSDIPSTKQIKQVKNVLQKVIEQRPKLVHARLLLTRCLIHLGNFRKAKTTLEPIIDDIPHHAEALELLAVIEAPENRPDERVFSSTTPLSQDLSTLSEYERWMVGAHKRQRSGKMEGALNAFRKASEIDPLATAPWMGIGWLHFEEKKYNDAVKAFNRAALLDHNNAGVQYGLGVTHLKMQAWTAALLAFENYVELSSEDDPYRDKARKKVEELSTIINATSSSR